MVWFGMVWYGSVWYGMVWYGTVWYGMGAAGGRGCTTENSRSVYGKGWGAEAARQRIVG